MHKLGPWYVLTVRFHHWNDSRRNENTISVTGTEYCFLLILKVRVCHTVLLLLMLSREAHLTTPQAELAI